MTAELRQRVASSAPVIIRRVAVLVVAAAAVVAGPASVEPAAAADDAATVNDASISVDEFEEFVAALADAGLTDFAADESSSTVGGDPGRAALSLLVTNEAQRQFAVATRTGRARPTTIVRRRWPARPQDHPIRQNPAAFHGDRRRRGLPGPPRQPRGAGRRVAQRAVRGVAGEPRRVLRHGPDRRRRRRRRGDDRRLRRRRRRRRGTRSRRTPGQRSPTGSARRSARSPIRTCWPASPTPGRARRSDRSGPPTGTRFWSSTSSTTPPRSWRACSCVSRPRGRRRSASCCSRGSCSTPTSRSTRATGAGIRPRSPSSRSARELRSPATQGIAGRSATRTASLAHDDGSMTRSSPSSGSGRAATGTSPPRRWRRSSGSRHRYLRTARHPSAHLVGAATSFDDVYEAADRFDDVYAEIVERLVAARHRARRDPLRRPRVAARPRTHGRVAARRRAHPTATCCRRCRSSTSPGRASASIRSRPACGSSTGTSSPAPPAASTVRC